MDQVKAAQEGLSKKVGLFGGFFFVRVEDRQGVGADWGFLCWSRSRTFRLRRRNFPSSRLRRLKTRSSTLYFLFFFLSFSSRELICLSLTLGILNVKSNRER